jgi:hypothetical protein
MPIAGRYIILVIGILPIMILQGANYSKTNIATFCIIVYSVKRFYLTYVMATE